MSQEPFGGAVRNSTQPIPIRHFPLRAFENNNREFVNHVPRLMTHFFRRQTTALKNLVVKTCSRLGAECACPRALGGLRGRISEPGEQVRGGRARLLWLLAFALSMGASVAAQAATNYKCGPTEPPFYGVIDGNNLTDAEKVDITQIQIVGDCTIQNFPYPPGLGSTSTTINFQIPNDQRDNPYIFVFDNVAYNGGMACASITEYMGIWWVNGSFHNIKPSCQDFMLPVDAIRKQNPAGQSTAAVGVPFTYTLTMPLMVKLTSTGYVYQDPIYDDQPLTDVHIYDDLTQTGADVTYLGNTAYLKYSNGSTTPIGSLTNLGDAKHLHFAYGEVPAGAQLVIELQVVLDKTAANVPGKQFRNTATWTFDKWINGLFRDNLPGQNGISDPMTIVGPELVADKSSTVSNLNLGGTAPFEIDVQNVGGADAWNVTVTDILPGEMCTTSPEPTVSAGIYGADGTTQVAALVAGTDYAVSYSGCELRVTLLDTPAAHIGPRERLIVHYTAALDLSVASGSYTNVAGATRWFNAPGSVASRVQYDRTLTNGTPGVTDFQDAYTINAAVAGYYFLKSVENLTAGTSPATTALPGDRLRYTIQIQNFTLPTLDVSAITDTIDGAFDPASLAIYAPGTNLPVTPTVSGGTISLPAFTVADNDQYQLQFDVTLKSPLAGGTVVPNQAFVSGTYPYGAETRTLTNAPSDDPHVDGPAQLLTPTGEPLMAGDPTTVTLAVPGSLTKANPLGKTTATIGEQFTYTVTVTAPAGVPLYDVRIVDTLPADVDLRFVEARLLADGRQLTGIRTGNTLVLEDAITGIDIPAGGQAVIEITVELQNTVGSNAGDTFSNSATYTYNRVNGDDATVRTGSGETTTAITVVEPALTAGKSVSFVTPAGKTPTDAATVGDVLEYVVTMTNGGSSTAFDASVVDTLPAELQLVPGSAIARIDGTAVAGFVATPATLPGGAFAWGSANGDDSLDVGPGQTLTLTYQATVVSVTGAAIVNGAHVDWTSLQGGQTAERTGEGCPSFTAPDDYCAVAPPVSVSTVDNTSIAKAVVADTYTEDPPAPSTADPVVRVGDTVTYDLTLNLQEYTTRSVVVTDVLPAGLALESFTIESPAGGAFSYTLSAQPAAGATGTLTWNFGDIVNAPNGSAVDPLVIRYVARVVTAAPPVGVDYTTSVQRTNTAQLAYTGGDPATYPGRLTAAETIDVRQPQMGTITKVDQAGGRIGSGTAADPYQVNLASDVMNFRLSSCNGGLAPAYGVVITDTLASQFNLASLAGITVSANGTTLAASDYTYTLSGSTLSFTLAAPVNPGQCVTVDYTVGFRTDVVPNQTWSNQAQLTQYASLPASGRVYTAADTAQVWMTNLVTVAPLAKALTSATEATVGQDVTYRITVPGTPMNAALAGVVVTDTLHGALEYVSATATVNGASRAVGITQAGQDLSLALGDLAAGEQAIVTLTARIANNDQANAGTTVANTASYSYTGMPAGSATAATSGALTIVEPLVTVAKSVPAASPQAGDLLTYTVSLAAAGGAAGDVYANAYDLAIVDSLGLGLAYEAGSATLNGAPLANPSVAGDGVATAQTLTWDPSVVDIDLAEGTTATVTYQVRVLDSVVPGQSLTNSVVARWTGLDGDQSAVNERTGSGGVNDYFTQPATTTLVAPLAVTVVKSVVNQTTGQTPGANARPGDTLHYTLVLTNESVVPLTNGALVDVLAAQFASGSLQILGVSDPNADRSNSNPAGGANGTGIVDIRNLTLAAQGQPGASVTVEFQATLAAVIPSGTAVVNQAQLSGDSLPAVASNQTSTLIASAPQLVVEKISQDVTGDANVLAAGDTLRYTITAKNLGNENASGVTLSDMIPSHTTYVAGTTRLNGVLVADPATGVSALQAGLMINAPGDAAGLLRADASGATVATATFDVVVNSSVVEGTLIANQGFVTGTGEGSGPFIERPSDDPTTPVVDDPTLDIVGNLPRVDAHKIVSIAVDANGNGAADPGDTLRYTIVVGNFGAVPATGVVLTDGVPQYTAYVANSVTLNGAAMADPAAGVSPLIGGVPLNSAGQPSGTIAAGASATIVFDVTVNGGVLTGTVISNQGHVATSGLPTEPTDADGIDTNGDQPTTIVVGSTQQLFITKEVFVVGGGIAQAGSELEYVVRVTNNGAAPATQVVLTDDLAALAGQATYVTGSATLNGATAGVSYVGTVLTADYAGDLAAGATATLRFRVLVASGVPVGTTLTNTAVAAWNTPTLTAQASVALAIGGLPGSVALNGRVWHDADFDNLAGSGEAALAGWTVTLHRNGVQLGSTTTDASGVYRFSGLAPTVTVADQYALRFTAPGATAATAKLGLADSQLRFTDGMQQITGIDAASGSNVQNLNLPIDPNGVVFDSITRAPVGGATLIMTGAGSTAALPAGCFDDPAQQGQVTLASGFYKFDLNYSDPACPIGGDYVIRVTPPGTGYNAGPSQVIPPITHDGTAAYSVATCSADAVTTPAGYCEAQASAYAPGLAVQPSQANHYLHLTLSNPVPNDSQLFNNHIAVDRVLQNALTISKTAGLVNVTRGQLVPYTITVNNTLGVDLTGMRIVDTFPPGFKYVAGSARVNGVAAEPVFTNRNLTWNSLNVVDGSPLTIKLLFIVGSGVGEGEYVNRAQVFHSVLGEASGVATATVRVVPDPTFDCTDIIGKVFDDGNRNGYQDDGEKGLPGVRVVTARGLLVTTDEHGRFHVTCAMVPDEDRGSNFILKVDDRTLPTGYRMTTENPRVQRITRGKMAKFNFGAAINKMVRIDVANGVFEPGATEMRIQWKPRMDLLVGELKKGPSILRLAYMAEIEDEKLVEARLKAMKQALETRWAQEHGPYELVIETEVFWRTGAPPARSALK